MVKNKGKRTGKRPSLTVTLDSRVLGQMRELADAKRLKLAWVVARAAEFGLDELKSHLGGN